ncbi:MAG TPA: hypothetical protein VFQ38_20565 [Longimicrobiales bacterium]|nr:hypothetical protein [Longimicrobiales bacterium]
MPNGNALLFGSITALVLACGGSATDPGPGRRVSLALDRNNYSAGGDVSVMITNLTELSLAYPGDFCPVSLQRFDAGSWVTVSGPPSGCALFLGILLGKQSARLVYHLPAELRAGTYRLLLPAPWPERTQPTQADTPQATPEFTVDSKAFPT